MYILYHILYFVATRMEIQCPLNAGMRLKYDTTFPPNLVNQLKKGKEQPYSYTSAVRSLLAIIQPWL